MPVNILIINNSVDEVDLLSSLANSWAECEIISAGKVEEALELLNGSEFDIIFIDLFLSGRELSPTFFLLDKICEKNRFPKNIVFLITKYAPEIPEDQSLKEKLKKYRMVNSPVDYIELHENNDQEIEKIKYWVEVFSSIIKNRETMNNKRDSILGSVSHYFNATIIILAFLGGIYFLPTYLVNQFPQLNQYFLIMISSLPALIPFFILYPSVSKNLVESLSNLSRKKPI